MNISLRNRESVEAGVKRIAQTAIDEALAGLRAAGREKMRALASVVHETRKRFKEIRAILRLVRKATGRRFYDRENTCFRDAGRALSAMRDAKVLLDTLAKLIEHFTKKQTPEDAVHKLRSALLARKTAASENLTHSPDLPAAVQSVNEAAERVACWPLDNPEAGSTADATQDAVGDRVGDWELMGGGLRRSYSKCRDAFECAIKQPDALTFHEWRKRTKDLWYHLEILQVIRPREMRKLADRFHDLSDDLGDEHDLSVLHENVSEKAQSFGAAQSVRRLLRLIERRRKHYRSSAKSLGKRLLRDNPDDFVAGIASDWKRWRTKYPVRKSKRGARSSNPRIRKGR